MLIGNPTWMPGQVIQSDLLRYWNEKKSFSETTWKSKLWYLISHLRLKHQIKSLEEITIVSYVDKLVKIYEIVSEKLFLFWQLSWIQIFTKIITLVEVYTLYHLCIGSYWFKYVNCFLRTYINQYWVIPLLGSILFFFSAVFKFS
jgi:hypothetical protein